LTQMTRLTGLSKYRKKSLRICLLVQKEYKRELTCGKVVVMKRRKKEERTVSQKS